MKIVREYEIDEKRKQEVIGTQSCQCIREKVDDMFIETNIYFYKKGKTTLKGKYPKLSNKCKYPEREDCDGVPECGYYRCEYMKYDNNAGAFSSNRWKCVIDK